MNNLSLFDRKFLALCHIQVEPSHKWWCDTRFLQSCGICPFDVSDVSDFSRRWVSDYDTRLFAVFQSGAFADYMYSGEHDHIDTMLAKMESQMSVPAVEEFADELGCVGDDIEGADNADEDDGENNDDDED